MRSKRPLVLGLLLTSLVAAHAGYWHWSAAALADRIAEWRDEQRARGYEIDYLGPEIGGYPFRLTVRFDEPRMRAPNGWHWSGPTFTGGAALWAPFTVEIAFSGRHEVGHESLGEPLDADVGRGEARVELRSDGRVHQAQGKLEAVQIANTPQGPVSFESLDFTLGPLVEARDGVPQQLELSGDLARLRLPELPQNPLGPQVERVAVAATLVGRIDKGDPRAALEAWRDAGGTAEIGSVEAFWGPLALAGDGSLALDERLRPLGAFSARVRGLGETIDAMARKQLIETGTALAARGLLAMMSERDEAGRTVVRLPITLQDGFLYLGPVPLLPLSPVL